MLPAVPEYVERELEWDETSERCFTILKGMAPAEALQALLPDAVTGIATPREIERWLGASRPTDGPNRYRQAAFAGTHEGWTWVFEPIGFAGTHFKPHAVTPAPSPYVSAYWNINALMRFRYLVNGEYVRDFDPLGRADHFAEDEPGSVDFEPDLGEGDLLPEEDGLDWLEPEAASMTLLVRLSGVTWPPTSDLVRSATAAVGYLL